MDDWNCGGVSFLEVYSESEVLFGGDKLLCFLLQKVPGCSPSETILECLPYLEKLWHLHPFHDILAAVVFVFIGAIT